METGQELEKFISSKENNGALLLTGKWGCGKSYLIKDIANKLNSENEYAIAIISLFGISSTEELNRRIKEEYLEFSTGFLNKTVQKTAKMFAGIAKEGTSIAAAALPQNVAASAISQGVSSIVSFDALNFVRVKNTVGATGERKFVLVFDDFERSEMPLRQLLGTINECTENREIRTIIVADEEKIKDHEYSEFKEKLISRTLKLTSDYSKIISNIIAGYKESCTGYQQFLNAHKQCIIRVFCDSEVENIRTAKALMIEFERVYSCWKNSGISLDKVEDVLYAFGCVMFEYKANRYENVQPYGYMFPEAQLKKRYPSYNGRYLFNSLRKWVTEGIWNENDFNDDLRRKFCIQELTNEQKFVTFRFLDLDNSIIDDGLPKAMQSAYEGKLKSDELICLLQNIFGLQRYQIKLPCEIDYSKMLSGFNARVHNIRSGVCEEPKRHTFIAREDVSAMDPLAQKLYKQIEKLQDKIIAWGNRKEVIRYLNGESSLSRYDLEYCYLVSFDLEMMEIFFEKYKKTENCMKRDCFLLIKNLCFNDKRVSDKEDIEETISNLKTLQDRLDEYKKSECDAISKIITDGIVGEISDLISELTTHMDIQF